MSSLRRPAPSGNIGGAFASMWFVLFCVALTLGGIAALLSM